MDSTTKTTAIRRLLHGFSGGCGSNELPTVDYREWRAKMEAEGREEARQLQLENQERVRKKRMEEIFGHAGIPPRFMDKGFDNFKARSEDQYRALATCRAFSESFEDARKTGASLILIGRPGTGKTHLACAIGREILDHGYTVLFTSVAELMRQVRDGYRGTDTEHRILQRFMKPDLLILDEVGIAIGREETRHAVLMDVINRRYENLKPSVLIGNMTADEMHRYLGDRIWRRVSEEGASVVSFTWDRQNRRAEDRE